MNKYNFSLVGFGRFGKVYLKEILNNKKILCNSIIKKKKYKRNTFKKTNIKVLKISDKLPLDCTDAAIIASPTKEHYSNALLFVKKKIPVIIEKPVSDKLINIVKLNKICTKKNVSALVNYSDLYNDNLLFFLKNRKMIGKIIKVKIIFHKRLNIYKTIRPVHDFLPHFFAVAKKLINIDGKFQIIKNEINKLNSFLYQSCIFSLTNNNNQTIEFNYSNRLFKKKRQVIVYGTHGKFSYDAYQKQNNFMEIKNKKNLYFKVSNKKTNSPIQNILNKMCYLLKRKKFQNDLFFSIKIQKITNKLVKNLKI